MSPLLHTSSFSPSMRSPRDWQRHSCPLQPAHPARHSLPHGTSAHVGVSPLGTGTAFPLEVSAPRFASSSALCPLRHLLLPSLSFDAILLSPHRGARMAPACCHSQARRAHGLRVVVTTQHSLHSVLVAISSRPTRTQLLLLLLSFFSLHPCVVSIVKSAFTSCGSLTRLRTSLFSRTRRLPARMQVRALPAGARLFHVLTKLLLPRRRWPRLRHRSPRPLAFCEPRCVSASRSSLDSWRPLPRL